jgi:phosphatidylserine synthase
MTTSAARYFHRSNLITYLSLLAGLLAIVSAKELGSLSVAGGLIALCALADTLDGKFARLFKRPENQKQFGVQLDSLTDALTPTTTSVLDRLIFPAYAAS